MKTINEMPAGIKSLKAQHANKQIWLTFMAKLETVAKNLGCKSDEEMEDAAESDFVAAGFSEIEAAALVFVMTQDCMGQACTSVEIIDRWFCYEA